MTAARPLLALEGVEKRFDRGTLALSGLTLAVEAGSFVSLLGPSGCGKSTVLRLVAGLAAPTRGTITWTGGGARPRLSFVFQEPTLMPWASVLENVLLPLRISRADPVAAEAKAREALAAVGLAGSADAFPRELSGGMRMRVSLARAVITEPDLLLLDEPFAALDEITRTKLTQDLAALWRARRFTALFVTHSVFESVYLAERVVVMAAHPGRIHADLPIAPSGPRDEAFRLGAEYAGMCRTASEKLREAMAE